MQLFKLHTKKINDTLADHLIAMIFVLHFVRFSFSTAVECQLAKWMLYFVANVQANRSQILYIYLQMKIYILLVQKLSFKWAAAKERNVTS